MIQGSSSPPEWKVVGWLIKAMGLGPVGGVWIPAHCLLTWESRFPHCEMPASPGGILSTRGLWMSGSCSAIRPALPLAGPAPLVTLSVLTPAPSRPDSGPCCLHSCCVLCSRFPRPPQPTLASSGVHVAPSWLQATGLSTEPAGISGTLRGMRERMGRGPSWPGVNWTLLWGESLRFQLQR